MQNFRISLSETRVYFKTAIVAAKDEAEARSFALNSGPWKGETQVLHDTIRSVTGAECIKTETEIQEEIAKLQRDLAALQGIAPKPAKEINAGLIEKIQKSEMPKTEKAYRLRVLGMSYRQIAERIGVASAERAATYAYTWRTRHNMPKV